MIKILLILGPNINLIGKREIDIYGDQKIENIINNFYSLAKELNIFVEHKQSNHEGDLIDWLQSAEESYQGIIINAGGLSHTSVSLLDAIRFVSVPVIEVHMSNIYAREFFRQKSIISQACAGVICGFGEKSYDLALKAILDKI